MTVAPPEGNSTGSARLTAPGLLEVLAGGAAYIASFAVVALALPLVGNEATKGLIGLLVSGLMGLTAFAVAVLVRIRGLAIFGVRRARPRHLVVGALLGLGAYILGTVVAIFYMVVTGDMENIQTSYQAAASAGWWSLALALIAGAILTPLGEESFFRGVLANALLSRYRAWIAVIVSATIFALAHGINPILAVAFVVGVLAALLFRWSGSIWPGVVLHGVNNAAGLLVPLLVALPGA